MGSFNIKILNCQSKFATQIYVSSALNLHTSSQSKLASHCRKQKICWVIIVNKSMHSSFTIPFPYFADTDHHSGSESSSSSGSDEQSGMSSINTTTASGYTSSGQPHQSSTTSNDGYYNSARNTTPQANGNQVIPRLVKTSFKIAVSSKASY